MNTEEEEKTCRSYKSFNPDSYKEDVKKYVDESNFKESMERKDLNTAFDSWLAALQKAANKHAPMKTFKPKKHAYPQKSRYILNPIHNAALGPPIRVDDPSTLISG